MKTERTRKKSVKPLPFGIVRKCGKSLVDQAVDGFKEAILSGYYRAGDFLPPFDEIAKELGVSLRVPTEVVKILASEGYVVPRPRIGSEVVPRRGCAWKGDVLLVLPAEYEYGYFAATLVGEMRKQLTTAGYLVDTVAYDKTGGQPNLQTLERKLDRHVDMAFLLYAIPQVAKRFVERGVPYFCLSENPYCVGHAVSSAVHSASLAVETLVLRLKALRVRDVLVLNIFGYDEIESGLRDADFRIESTTVPNAGGFGYEESLQKEALLKISERFSGDRRNWPDVLLISDDVLARGALMAILHLGIRIPEDLRVVTFVNVGDAPVFPSRLAMIENDPRSNAHQLVSAMLDHAAGKAPLETVEMKMSFRDGETL